MDNNTNQTTFDEQQVITDASVNIYEPPSDKIKFLKFITLTEGTTRINFITFTICTLITISTFTFMTSADSYILNLYLKIPMKEQGTKIADLAMVRFLKIFIYILYTRLKL